MLNHANSLQIRSLVTCPECRAVAIEHMPVDARQWFYRCNTCDHLITPKSGECCVFCAYGTIPCPSVQLGTTCRKHA
ncbi:GDCCVxC domain-containing (seleno)protein [Simiduia aestuariiviva]|uniref:Uncharacterized protein n=1 Tax=Simiduia aestuariiviva TaxID=1510459 RepID=A0A839UL08_9GAMM|nr:GDCCVxC domain-containing (seleno)protein [Simiduia aestuariiviva]MBB3167451.1 hypothetical protein [Simiduia aestuariiviva]